MAMSEMLNQAVSTVTGGAKKVGLFSGAKTKAVIVLTQYWSAEEKDAANKGVDKNGNISVNGLSKTTNTGKINIEKPVTVATASSGLGGALGGASALSSAASALSKASSLASTVAGAVSKAAGALTDNTGAEKAGSVVEGQTESRAGMTRYSVEYTVMFNPATLEIASNGGGLIPRKKFNQAADGKSTSSATYSVEFIENTNRSVTMSVQLIFDKVDETNAFSEINPFNLTESVGMVKNAFKAAVGQTYSVQRDVEGFLAAIQDKCTSEVTFRWGDMEYSGIIRQVNANYVMFNPAGEPIRAVVNMTLRIIDPYTTISSMGSYFDEAFRNVLESDEIQENGYISWNTTENMTGSVL